MQCRDHVSRLGCKREDVQTSKHGSVPPCLQSRTGSMCSDLLKNVETGEKKNKVCLVCFMVFAFSILCFPSLLKSDARS